MSLATENRRLAFWTVRKIRARDRDDVASAALLGLVEAEQKHDPARGSFASLAVILCRRRAFEELYRQRRHEKAETTLHYVAPDGTEEERTELPPVPAVDAEAPLMAVKLREALAALSAREREIVVRHYGLDGPGETLAETARAVGITRQGAALAERRALGKLRRALTRKR